jgi:hypothetical protein
MILTSVWAVSGLNLDCGKVYTEDFCGFLQPFQMNNILKYCKINQDHFLSNPFKFTDVNV